jgi:hypothetical protein
VTHPVAVHHRAGHRVSGRLEHIRCVLAVPTAFLASALAIVCVVSVPDVLPAMDDLVFIDERTVGWSGVAAAVGLALAAASLLVVGRVGSGPALSLGAAGSVFGLALAHDVADAFQLSLAQLLLAGSVGCLLAGAASMTFELAAPYRHYVVVAWSLPVLTAWPLLASIAGDVTARAADEAPRLTLHPPVVLLAPVTALIVVWSALTMLLEPVRAVVVRDAEWESAWTGLVAIGLGGALAIMLLGFDTGLDAGWLRPLVLLGVGGVLVSLAGLTFLIPQPTMQIGYLCLAVVMLCFPVCVQLLVVVADGGSAQVGVALLLAVAAAGGGCLGGWRPVLAPLGFLAVAVGCAGSWVMPGTPWLMAVGAVPLCLGMGMAFGAGVRHASTSAVGWRFGSMTVVVIVLLGGVVPVALGWALGADLPADTDSARAAGRVFLGLTFALAVATSAAVHVLAPPPGAGRPGEDGRSGRRAANPDPGPSHR